MFSIYYKNKIKNIFENLTHPKPLREVLEANYHKLPEKIEVGWFRDGKFIIGIIKVDGKEYKTQALSADEFVDMVNDTIYTVYDIPNSCINILSKERPFVPTSEQFKKLNDNAIKQSAINMAREKELVYSH
jgi:hypothetical protein